MLYKVLGVKCLDFESGSGDKVQGIKLYCSTDADDDEVYGETVDTFFLSSSSDNFSQFSVYCKKESEVEKLINTFFEAEFNRKGKLISVNWYGEVKEQKE